ncbi:protein FAM160B2-like [Cyprinodon tularosa]|uniref:protein FAM160B2-like n=1 Tax=Cyprinodon tularosa TaxID=77115 RepID=UPI0018E2193A|nr:protein FAM160B2-like [Cyprinodon tularosa]
MEMFNKLSGMLLGALEAREPTVDLLDSFVDHWRSITTYYIQTTDDSRPASQTDIPWRLRQMSDILVYEEKQQDVEQTGPCLQYLLQHKLLETMTTLAKAQYPPGMTQQVLIFVTKLLLQMQKPLLQLVPVYRPVQKLIELCAPPGSGAEKEEVRFLFAVCSRLNQDPHVLQNVLQLPDQQLSSSQSADAASSQSEPSASSPVHSQQGLLWVLVQLSRSPRPPVRLKACEGLLLLSALLDGSSEELLPAGAQLGELLAGRLQELYCLLPQEQLEAEELRSWPRPSWRSESQLDHLTSFLSWFHFLDQLTTDAPQVLSVQVSQCVRGLWLMETLLPQLLHTCEQNILVSTSVLCHVVRMVQSPSLLEQLLHFLLRTPSLMEQLLRRCDHVSEQISMTSLSLVEELLQKPHRDILDHLVLSFLQSRSYLSSPVGVPEERQPDSGEEGEDPQDLDDDPFFSDGFPDDHLPPPLHQPAAPGSAADVVNSFLCLVPVQVRSAHLLQEGGYESYVLDARSLVAQCRSLSLSWDWPKTLPPPTCSPGKEGDFFEGHLLKVLFERLGRILQQPYELSLQLTAILSRLSSFDHPLLDEYLLDPYVPLSPSSKSLFSVLVRVMGELVQRTQQVSNISERLMDTRRHLLGLNQNPSLEHLTLLQGIIVLEEFCKELAAIAFIKMPLDRNQQNLSTEDESAPGSTGLLEQNRPVRTGTD